MDGLDFRRATGADIAAYADALARLRIDLFRAFPYLYDGDREGDSTYERDYLRTYVDAPGSVAFFAFAGNVLAGASTGIPLADETDDCRAPFVAGGYDVASVFYCGESLLRPEFRGRGIYRRFLEGREAFARERGFATCAFCAVERPADHARRPPGYEPLDAIWRRFGYERHPDLVARYRWKDLDDDAETEKPMVFWLKALAA